MFKKLLHKNNHIIFIIEILIVTSITIFTYRSYFSRQIDYEYLNDLYSHSQWSMPLSTRIMSDGDLYQVSGKRLLDGASAFSIAPEVPLVGKYLFGLGIMWWSNPYLVSLGFYLLTVVGFIVLSFQVFSDKKLAKISSLLFILSPILSNQIYQLMLDLPQLSFLLFHLISIIALQKSKKKFASITWTLLAGISLGLFAGTKIPVLILPLTVINFFYLYKNKKIYPFFTINLIAGITYFTSYLPTIINYHLSIIDWLKTQWWMINFYRSSDVKNNPIYYLIAVLGGYYKGWWDNSSWQRIAEWTIIWPLSVIASIKLGINNFQKRTVTFSNIAYLNYLGIGFLLSWLLMPFWSRYFLLAIPFSIISLVSLLSLKKTYLRILLVISVLFFSYSLTINPVKLAEIIQEKFSTGNYQDFYDLVESNYSRENFYLILKNIQLDTQAQAQSLKISQKNKQEAILTITYKTPIGTHEHSCVAQLAKSQNKWFLDWNWECIAPDFSPEDQLKTTLLPATQGQLINQDQVVLSSWGENYYLSANISKASNHDYLKTNLAQALNTKEAIIEKKLYVDYKGLNIIPIGFVDPNTTKEDLVKVLNDPAIIAELRPTRIYHPQLKEKYLDKIIALEKANPKLYGSPGGQLIHYQPQKQKILLQKEATPGKDVLVETEFSF